LKRLRDLLRFSRNSLSAVGSRKLRALAEELPAQPKTGKRNISSLLLTTRIPTSNIPSVDPSPFRKSLSDLPCDTCPYAVCDPNNCALESVRESELIFGGLSS